MIKIGTSFESIEEKKKILKVLCENTNINEINKEYSNGKNKKIYIDLNIL